MVAFQFNRQQWKTPVWVAFPDVSPETYPRPDAWNAYGRGWTEWYLSLSREERNAYEDEFPEPEGWQDSYRFVSNQPR